MEKDVLVILMIAFGLFAILMFILFYIYTKKYFNEKKLSDNYEDDDEIEDELKIENDKPKKVLNNDEMDFVPKKKK